jgi:hypothetical protein
MSVKVEKQLKNGQNKIVQKKGSCLLSHSFNSLLSLRLRRAATLWAVA